MKPFKQLLLFILTVIVVDLLVHFGHFSDPVLLGCTYALVVLFGINTIGNLIKHLREL